MELNIFLVSANFSDYRITRHREMSTVHSYIISINWKHDTPSSFPFHKPRKNKSCPYTICFRPLFQVTPKKIKMMKCYIWSHKAIYEIQKKALCTITSHHTTEKHLKSIKVQQKMCNEHRDVMQHVHPTKLCSTHWLRWFTVLVNDKIKGSKTEPNRCLCSQNSKHKWVSNNYSRKIHNNVCNIFEEIILILKRLIYEFSTILNPLPMP